MVKLEHDVVVERPVAEVFAYLTDPANVPEWQSDVLEARKEFEGPPRPGSRWCEVRKFLGRRIEQTIEAVAYEPEREFTLRVVAGPIPFEVRHLFSPDGDGTRITVEGEGEPGRLFKVGKRFVTRAVERQFQRDFGRLKEILEARRP